MSRRTLRYVPSLACCAILALAGCGSNSTGSSAAPTPSTAPLAAPDTAPPTTPGPADTSAAADTTQEGSSIPACTGDQLIMGTTVMSSGATHRAVRLTFQLVQASGPCVLTGYPGVDSGTGGPLLHARRTPRGYLGGLPPNSTDTPPTVVLDHDHGATAVVEGRATDNAGNQCPTYTDLLVTAPNTTTTERETATIDTCTLEVHPVTAM
jgi:hypothetical protein